VHELHFKKAIEIIPEHCLRKGFNDSSPKLWGSEVSGMTWKGSFFNEIVAAAISTMHEVTSVCYCTTTIVWNYLFNLKKIICGMNLWWVVCCCSEVMRQALLKVKLGEWDKYLEFGIGISIDRKMNAVEWYILPQLEKFL